MKKYVLSNKLPHRSHEGKNGATNAIRCNLLMAEHNLFIGRMHFSLYKTVGVSD